MKKYLLLFLILAAYFNDSQAQFTRYIVKFKNKGGGNPYTLGNPSSYLSAKAIARRTKYSIALDSTDIPVTPAYVNQVKAISNVTLLNVSRWLNGVTIQTSDANAITAINALPFVQSVTGSAARMSGDPAPPLLDKFEPMRDGSDLTGRPAGIESDYFNYGSQSFAEIHLHNGEFLHNIGLRGQTMQIAMLDNGFNNYTALRAFDSMNTNGQVLGTWDFVAREANVSNDGSHGMNCLSTIVANIPGTFIGKAPKASFWLFQTEDNSSEYPIEEFNWVCGAERADSSGTDVISSSLGYMTFDNASLNHTYADMNGNTTMAAIGADLAAKKGILVFLAAGNEGTNSWHYIITPADADSVVAVGAVNTAGAVGSFSSYGPSSDGQVKPDVASIGVNALVQTTSNTVGTSNGTSFACPNMAGLGTCLWQGFPEFNNMAIILALQLSGNRAATPDNRTGYGIPNVKAAFAGLLVAYATSSSSLTGCAVTLNWSSKDVSAMKYEVERKGPTDPAYVKIADVNPLGNTILSNQTYQFVNNLTSGSSGLYSYRIRQVIDTALASFMAVYIDTTNITVSSPCIVTGVGNVDPVKRSVTVIPNPSYSNTASIVIETPFAIVNMPILLYDANGSLVMKMSEQKGTGKKTIPLGTSRLPKGKYFIRVFNGEQPLGTAEWLKL
jgi:serine protease AprX